MREGDFLDFRNPQNTIGTGILDKIGIGIFSV